MKPTTCSECGAALEPYSGKGRPFKYCEAHRRTRRPGKRSGTYPPVNPPLTESEATTDPHVAVPGSRVVNPGTA
jgi:hypothetical protein